MAVFKHAYKGYEGPLTPTWSRFLVLPRYAFEEMRRKRFYSMFFLVSMLAPLIYALIIYIEHNLSALKMLQIRDLVPINARFFLNFLGWQSMMAFFLAAFVGPGQISPDLANNALAALSGAAVFAHRIRARQALRAADPDVGDDLDSRPAALHPASIARRRRLVHPEPAHRQRHLLRRVDLDSAALAAGPGALGLGEVEAHGRRPAVRRLLRGRRIRRRHQCRACAPNGATC